MIKGFIFNPIETNCYLIASGGKVAVVDPGCYSPAEADFLEKAVGEAGQLTHILLTHGHPDHCFGAARLSRKYGVPVTFSPDDAYILERSGQLAGLFGLDSVDTGFEKVPAKDGDAVKIGDIELGNTPVCLALVVELPCGISRTSIDTNKKTLRKGEFFYWCPGED